MQPIVSLIYSSAAAPDFDEAELPHILERSRADNGWLGVTGMLLYADRSFFQVLEGTSTIVDALVERIARDPRHRRMNVLVREPILARMFSDWTMGHPRISRSELAALDGGGDSAATSAGLQAYGPGRARTLLRAFAAPRGRTRLAVGDRALPQHRPGDRRLRPSRAAIEPLRAPGVRFTP
jgi:hypothetical protein